MKKYLLVLIITIVYSVCIGIAHADISMDVILSTLSEDELVSTVENAGKLLEKYGYSVIIEKNNNSSEPIEDNNQAVQSTAMAKNAADEQVLKDLIAGWEARADKLALDNGQSSLMNDKQYIEYYTECINLEYSFINKYRNVEFEDSSLTSYIQNYISALDEQYIAITEYYGKDVLLFNTYWNNGYFKKSQALYWLNRKWGLPVQNAHQTTFATTIAKGKYWDMKVSVENNLIEQLTNLNYSLMDPTKYGVYISPITIKNDSPYSIPYLSVTANLLDTNGNIIQTAYLSSANDISAGKTFTANRTYVTTKFDQISLSCSYSISDGYYYDTFDFEVTPLTQYGWNGMVTQNGNIAAGQAIYTLENLSSAWETNSSLGKTLYVPVLKFSVKNTGTQSGDRVTVHVIFTNEDTKEVWDEKTSYVITSSDSPLKPGYSKKAFVYAGVGYITKPISLPNLSASIYVNDIPIETISIQK